MRHHIMPMILIVFFTPASVLLGLLSKKAGLSNLNWALIWGTPFSWCVVLSLIAWAILFLKLPSKKYLGPKTPFGYTPSYQANGVLYYTASIVSFLLLATLYPNLPGDIYDQHPAILASFNMVALTLCAWLYFKGKYFPESQEKLPQFPAVFEFFRGMEIHPQVFGVDVKQLTNCRVGLMAWQLLVIIGFITGCQRFGWNHGFSVNAILQTMYLAKFYYWETGYFTTLDITLDRAGYYICYGCLVFVPGLYTFSSIYFVEHPPRVSTFFSCMLLIGGILSLALNYEVDRQKQVFRNTDGQCLIWGKRAKYVEAEYSDSDGEQRTKLLTSAFWGMARHTNYVFEITLSLCWLLPGLGLGIFPFLYAIHIVILLVHRIFRDEEKCANKYGIYWQKYCQIVRYRLIPNVF